MSFMSFSYKFRRKIKFFIFLFLCVFCLWFILYGRSLDVSGLSSSEEISKKEKNNVNETRYSREQDLSGVSDNINQRDPREISHYIHSIPSPNTDYNSESPHIPNMSERHSVNTRLDAYSRLHNMNYYHNQAGIRQFDRYNDYETLGAYRNIVASLFLNISAEIRQNNPVNSTDQASSPISRRNFLHSNNQETFKINRIHSTLTKRDKGLLIFSYLNNMSDQSSSYKQFFKSDNVTQFKRWYIKSDCEISPCADAETYKNSVEILPDAFLLAEKASIDCQSMCNYHAQIENLDFISFLEKCVENHNNSISDPENQINFTNKSFCINFVEKIISGISTNEKADAYDDSTDIFSLEFEALLEKVLHKYNENILILINCQNDLSKLASCVKTYLYGLEFKFDGSYCPKGRILKNKEGFLLISAIGKQVLKSIVADIKEDKTESLREKIDIYKNSYNDQFSVIENSNEFIIKKDKLKEFSRTFYNPCLLKILQNCRFSNIISQDLPKSGVKQSHSFHEALIQNQNFDQRISFANIKLSIEDLKNLLYSDEYLTNSEVFFSQQFHIKSPYADEINTLKTLRDGESELNKYGIEIPTGFLDLTDLFVMNEPLRMSNTYTNLSDKLNVFKCHIYRVTLNPTVGTKLCA
ncbi:hypothetical protein EDEG_04094, partial [Edhazardia aedis USNM 41457]